MMYYFSCIYLLNHSYCCFVNVIINIFLLAWKIVEGYVMMRVGLAVCGSNFNVTVFWVINKASMLSNFA